MLNHPYQRNRQHKKTTTHLYTLVRKKLLRATLTGATNFVRSRLFMSAVTENRIQRDDASGRRPIFLFALTHFWAKFGGAWSCLASWLQNPFQSKRVASGGGCFLLLQVARHFGGFWSFSFTFWLCTSLMSILALDVTFLAKLGCNWYLLNINIFSL